MVLFLYCNIQRGNISLFLNPQTIDHSEGISQISILKRNCDVLWLITGVKLEKKEF